MADLPTIPMHAVVGFFGFSTMGSVFYRYAELKYRKNLVFFTSIVCVLLWLDVFFTTFATLNFGIFFLAWSLSVIPVGLFWAGLIKINVEIPIPSNSD